MTGNHRSEASHSEARPRIPAELRRRRRVILGLVILAAAAIIIPAVLFLATLAVIESRGPSVTIYTSQDQTYSQPILQQFQQETGIRVRAVYDSEAVKTVGLANRLLAERRRPRCDVFWSNEELRTRQLAAQDVFRETNGWAAFGYRTRRIVVNTNLLPLAQAPTSLLDLTNSSWRGKVALAYPLFGTTATHFLMLREHWGHENWKRWCRALVANDSLVVDGNSVVVRMVGAGEAMIGLTDSDDIAAGQREGLPVAALPVTEEAWAIPNTVAVVRGAPHPENAQVLFDWLQRPEVVRRLVEVNALEGADTSELEGQTLQPDWDAVLRDLAEGTELLGEIFLR